jgi:hypothetical protein
VHALNNPEFIGSAADAVEVILAAVAVAGVLAAGIGAILRAVRTPQAWVWGAYLALAVVTVFVGVVIRGTLGAVVATLPFLVAAVVAARSSTRAPSTLLAAAAVAVTCAVLAACIVRAPAPDRR